MSNAVVVKRKKRGGEGGEDVAAMADVSTFTELAGRKQPLGGGRGDPRFDDVLLGIETGSHDGNVEETSRVAFEYS